jgi:hypothetical protein
MAKTTYARVPNWQSDKDSKGGACEAESQAQRPVKNCTAYAKIYSASICTRKGKRIIRN